MNPATSVVGPGFEMAQFGNRIYFNNSDLDHGMELWSSDGTAAGTKIVGDLIPGPNSSLPTNLTPTIDLLFFQANYTASGVGGSKALWVSDGTTSGTHMLRQIGSGQTAEIINPAQLTPIGNTLYFTVSNGSSGNLSAQSVWKSDGTLAGTLKLASFVDNKQVVGLTRIGTSLYFAVQSSGGPQTSTELWKSDGTIPGTVRVAGGFGIISSQAITSFGGMIYFLAEGNSGSGLWKTNGTEAGTSFVAAATGARELVALDTRLAFSAITNNLQELWVSDGTTGGTAAIATMPARSLTVVGGRLFFAGVGDKVTTLNGNSIVELTLATASHDFSLIGNTTYFIATSPAGTDLWKTDATPVGTSIVRDPGITSASAVRRATTLGTQVIFTTATSLWKSDGTPTGTQEIRSLAQGELGSRSTSAFAQRGQPYLTINGTTFFSANDGSSGNELWASDGTTAGTRRVTDLRLGASGSDPTFLTAFSNSLLFFANDGRGHALWQSDGTEAGTTLVKIFSIQASTVSKPVIHNGLLLFEIATSNGFGSTSKLWRSDGTPDGTQSIHDIFSINELTAFKGKIYFNGANQLWVTDGTDAGTTELTSITTPLVGGLTPRNLTVFMDQLYFFGTQTKTGLWKSDGTIAGTQLVKDLNADAFFPGVGLLTGVGDTLFFVTDNFLIGRELWASDGSEAGTRLVRDINRSASFSLNGTLSSDPGGLIAIGSKLLFSADDGIHGRELWTSDGTEAGTTLLIDLYSGGVGSIEGSYSQNVAPLLIQGRVLFVGSNLTSGVELWQTDGTAAGTTQITDIAAGPGSANVIDIAPIGKRVFMSASDTLTGQEIWSVPLEYRVALPLITRL